MRILWDFRLFSLGYASRGVGRWALASARAIISAGLAHELTIWGDAQRLPGDVRAWPARWIPYRGGNWRSDLLRIPWLLARHRIDCMHYWIALGPLYRIGMGAAHPCCAACATVYDLGVEFWNEIPLLAARRRSWYWRAQKALASTIDAFVCISRATETDLRAMLPRVQATTIPAPYIDFMDIDAAAAESPMAARQPFFIALGGAPNKNLATTLRAFALVSECRAAYRLIVCGSVDIGEETSGGIPPGVSFESMDFYRRNVRHAAALLVCSTREGLGLPLLEAMAAGCPVIAADIPSLREIGENAALFVDPRDPASIAQAMADVVAAIPHWSRRSRDGAARYRERTRESGRAWLDLYARLHSRRVT